MCRDLVLKRLFLTPQQVIILDGPQIFMCSYRSATAVLNSLLLLQKKNGIYAFLFVVESIIGIGEKGSTTVLSIEGTSRA